MLQEQLSLSDGPSSGVLPRKARLLETFLLVVVVAGLFALHTRWILTHFSNEGYLLDAGWLAYLFGSGDPLIKNPSSINTLSFHAHHLSPHIFLFGAPFVWLFHLNGITIFALHQGLFFSLFAVAAWLLATASPVRYPTRAVLLASALLAGALGNALFQAAGYPHYEIAMIAVTAFGLAAGVRGYWQLFVVCLVWLPLIREDGGFFAAFVCLACIAMQDWPWTEQSSRVRFLATAAAIEVIAGLCAFVVKSTFFPGFDAFSGNFSGDGWSHVTRGFIVERLMSVARNPTIMPAIVGSALLAARDPRYAAAVLLLSPLYALHVLSVRPEHGNFTLYYALPWLLPPLTWLAVFTRRTTRGRAHFAEVAVIALASLALAAPVHAALRLPGQFWHVAEWSVSRPVVNLASMRQFVPWAVARYGKIAGSATPGANVCVSMGIAALTPNRFTPQQVVNAASDLKNCRPLLLLRADMDYGPLTSNAERIGFALAGTRQNAEMWLPSGR